MSKRTRGLRRRDWIVVLILGGVIGGAAVVSDLREEGGSPQGSADLPTPPSPSPGMDVLDLAHPPGRDDAGEGGGRASPERGAAGVAVEGVTRLRSHTIVDQTGFGEPVEAVSVLVPQGWHFDSRVRWRGEGGFCSADLAGVFWDARSPDGAVAVGTRPGIFVSNWPDTFHDQGVAPSGSCHLGSFASTESFAEGVLLPILLPGSRILEVGEIADIPPEFMQMARARSEGDALMGGRTTASGTAMRVRTPDNAHEVLVVVHALTSRYPSPNPGIPGLEMTQTAPPLLVQVPVGSRAEDAEAALSTAATILSTVRFNPGWQRALQELDAQLSRIAVQGAAERSRILADSFREVGELQMSGWRNRSEADWRGAQAVADALGGWSRRVDPHTGREVRLDATGTRFFANAAGDYLVVHEPDLDPRRIYPGEGWREMGTPHRPR